MNITFRIIKWELYNVKYELKVDGETAMETKDSLEEVIKEMKKYLRLRFKETLK